MPVAKLNAEQVESRLQKLSEWSQSSDTLQRTLNFPSFAEAIAFVNQVAALAESQDHHPDILIRYSKVTLNLSTHDAGGITEKDFDLAEGIERLHPAAETGGSR